MKLRLLLAVFALVLAVRCSEEPAPANTGTLPDAGEGTDAASAGDDAAQPGADAAQAGPDAAQAGADAAQAGPDAGADVGPGAGVVALAQLSGKAPVGGVSQTTLLLGASAQVESASVAHDFASNPGSPIGCIADYYSAAKARPADLDDGVITISGYAAAGFAADGGTVPPEVKCAREAGNYRCRFGADGGLGADPETLPLDPGSGALGTGTSVTFQAAGGAEGGSWSKAASATETVSTAQDLDALTFDPFADLSLSLVCPGPGCGVTLMVVTVDARQNPRDTFDAPSPTSGRIVCTAIASSGIVIPKQAISVLLGCNAVGGCDAALKLVRTRVFRAPLVTPFKDSTGQNNVTVLLGRGVFGYSAR